MRVFAVRSVDGQLGIVAARNKVHAVERLDEFANFEGCPIRELPESMLLLDISDEGELTLAQLGEEMDAVIRAFAYPLVEKVLNSDRTPANTALIGKAVASERERVRRTKTTQPLTERGREMKQQLDVPASLVRKQERRLAHAVLERTRVPNDPRKPH